MWINGKYSNTFFIEITCYRKFLTRLHYCFFHLRDISNHLATWIYQYMVQIVLCENVSHFFKCNVWIHLLQLILHDYVVPTAFNKAIHCKHGKIKKLNRITHAYLTPWLQQHPHASLNTQINLNIHYVISNMHIGQVTKMWLSCYLDLLSIDSKTR